VRELQRAPPTRPGRYLEGVEGAAENEQAVVAQRRHHPQVGGVADQLDLVDAGVVVDHLEAGESQRRSILTSRACFMDHEQEQ